jgi:alpha-methylacyl-CoA racemase
VDLLADADTCVAPVLTASEAAADPGFRSRRAFAETTGSAGPGAAQLAPQFAGVTRQGSYALPDRSVTDTDLIFAEAGLSADEVAELRSAGAIA